jgi:putative transposase
MSEFLKHNRHSIRIKDYDYSHPGGYFVTICTQNKECLFGKVNNAQMELNIAGFMVQKWWLRLEENIQNIKIDQFIIMPNHFHGIIFILDKSSGKSEIVYPKIDDNSDLPSNSILNYTDFVKGFETDERVCPENKGGKHVGLPLPRMIQWFKTMTTNEYIQGVKKKEWPCFSKRVWQRNYYEHILRDNNDLVNAQRYILENPKKWESDKYFYGF